MTLGHMLERAEARGEARGETRGEERINKLYEELLKSGRIDEMKRAMQDKEYRKRLLEEFQL